MAAAVAGAAVLAAALVLVGPAAPASAHTPHDTIIDLAVSPTFGSDRTLFVISREQLLKSTDAGATWLPLVRGLDFKGQLSGVTLVRDQPETLYASTRGGGVYRSDDGGLTWSARTAGMEGHLNLAWIEASPVTPDVVLASEAWGGALFRSGDGGRSWTNTGFAGVTSAGFAPDDADLVMIGDAKGHVRTSGDGGATWSEPEALVEPPAAVRTIALGPAGRSAADRDVFVGADATGIQVSHDGGASFAELDTEDRTRSVVLSPRYGTDHRWWASTWGTGVCRTLGDTAPDCRTKGLTQNEQADWLAEPGFGRVAVPADGDGGTLFVGAFTGLFRSDDNGRSWTEIQTQGPQEVVSISVARSGPGPATVVLTNYLNGVFANTPPDPTWTEIDKGLATYPQWTGEPTYVARLISVTASPDFEHDRTLLASNRAFLMRSTDAGATWEEVTPPGMINRQDRPPDYFWVAFSPAFARDRIVLLGTNRGKTFRSSDGGSTWTRLDDLDAGLTTMAISPAFDRDATVFASTTKSLYRSTDGGTTWTALKDAPRDVVSLTASPAFADDGTLFAGTSGGLEVSTDRGATWVSRQVGAAPLDGYVESVVPSPAFASDGTVLVSMRGRGLFRSTDGGRTFAPVAPDLLARQVVFSNWYHATTEPIAFSPDFARDRTVYGYTDSMLYRSTDGGDSWTLVDRPLVSHSTDPEAAPAPLLQTQTFPGETDDEDDHGGHGGGGEVAAAPSTSAEGGGSPVATSTSPSGTSPLVAVGVVLAVLAAAGGIIVFRRRRLAAD